MNFERITSHTVEDLKAYALKFFFNFLGNLGSLVLNFNLSNVQDIFRNLAYGNDPQQKIDIFRPPASKPERLPVLVYFHGGGWISADKKHYDGICARLSENGFLIFNVNYRLAPRTRIPAQLQDVAHAIGWTHRNAENYGGDNARIFLAGDSAGAQLVAWYASALHRETLFAQAGIHSGIPGIHLQGLLLFYGVFNFESVRETRFPFIKIYAKSFLGVNENEYARNAELASPIRHVSRNFPPVFLCAGERDGLYPQTVEYVEALKDCGVICSTRFFPREFYANHGFLFFRWFKPTKMAFAAVDDYLQRLK